MLKNSSKFTNAIKSDIREMKARVTINNIVFDDDVINKIDFSGSALSGEQFSLGSTHENSVSIEFSEVIETIAPLDLVQVEIGIKRESFNADKQQEYFNGVGKMRMGAPVNIWNVTEEYEYSLLGEFYVSDYVDINYNDKITTLECKDKMIFMEDAYVSDLDYPTDVRNVVVEISNQAGVEIDTLNIEELDGLQIDKIDGYSYRQALGFIAQLLVGYATFNHKGLLQIRTLNDTEYDVSPDEYFSKGLSKNGIRYKIRGITCTVPNEQEPQELFVGSKKGPQLTIENPLMTQSELQRIFNALQDVDYYPYELSWRGNPALEIGDVVTVYDLEGNELRVPNLNYTLNYTGGLSATSSADSKSRLDVVPSGRKTYQQQIHATQTKIKETATNLQNAFKDAQEKITGNQGGFIIQRLNEDGKPYELLVMDTEDINSATNVIRLNQQGIGFSQNGYNGPFGVAITIDGQIVADYITAGTLSAELIQSGFNGISEGVSITKDGLITMSSGGHYTQMVSGSLRVFDAEGNMTGTFGLSIGSESGSTGSAIFASTGHAFSIIRNGHGEVPNTTLFRIPTLEDVVQIFAPLELYASIDMKLNQIRNASAINATSVATTNGEKTGLFSTWSTGHAFIGGDNGVRLGYRVEGGSLYSLLILEKEGNLDLYTNFDLHGWKMQNVGEFSSSGKMEVANLVSANYFNLKGTNQYLINSSGGGGAYIDTMQVSMGIGTSSSWSNKWIVKTDVTESWNNIDMKGRTITNQSDSRLKTNIIDSEYDVLKEAERIRVIEYEWDLNNPANKNKPVGKQFGLQAQSTPFLQTKSANDESYLSIDLFKQINYNTFLGKRLNEERIKHAEEIDLLKTEIELLKEKIGV